jgi:hypothetical protein
MLARAGHERFLRTDTFSLAMEIACAHQKWPWDWQGEWQTDPVHRALAATLAVADLLDEDAARCDTDTLFHHRQGTPLNFAHWLRHSLTDNRIKVESGQISITMLGLPGTGPTLAPVYGALRNHFRLVLLYSTDLRHLAAEIANVNLRPTTGIPTGTVTSLSTWSQIPGFANEAAICYHLLTSFMPEAIKDSRRCRADTLAHLTAASLEEVDCRLLFACEGTTEPRTVEETTFHALIAQSI